MATIPENPITRRETYLAKIAGQNVQLPDAPLTREETYLDAIAKKGGGGSLPTGALKLKGRVDSFAQLPTAGNEDGDVYIVGLPTATEKSEYYWFNDRWDYLGETPIDTSELVKKTDIATTSKYGLTKHATQSQIDEEINSATAITPKRIPHLMSNYNIDKTTINRTNDIIGYRQKNLLKLDYKATFISHGVTAVCNGDGSITFNGTADADTVIIWSLPNKNAVSSFENAKYFKNGEYIKGGLGSKANLQWVEYNTSSDAVVTNSNSVKVINNSYAYNTIRIVVPNGSTFDNETMYPYVYYSNETDLTYEPYKKDINTRLSAIETSPMMNEVIISASEYANIDVNDYPAGTRFMIWDDSSLNTPSVQTLSIVPMMSGFALSEENGEEMEEVEGDTLNSLQTANNLRFADTLTETSHDIEEGDSE